MRRMSDGSLNSCRARRGVIERSVLQTPCDRLEIMNSGTAPAVKRIVNHRDTRDPAAFGWVFFYYATTTRGRAHR